MTEEELYDIILDADFENFQGGFYEYLGITKKQYKILHCKSCKKPKWEREFCDAIHPYGCIINLDLWEKLKEKAWKLYCKETNENIEVRDYWQKLPIDVQRLYINKVKNH